MDTTEETGQDVLVPMDYPTSICLVCNRTFPLPNPTKDSEPILNAEELRKIEECFATNLGLSPEEMGRVSFFTKPEVQPFCSRCTPMAKNLLKLQTRLTQIREKLARATIDVATIIVHTYGYTLDESPFFEMKNLIFQKWYDKLDEDCAEEEEEEEMVEVPPIRIKQEIITPSTSPETKQNSLSREVAKLKKKGKGDVKPISIDDEEKVEEVTCEVCKKIYRSKEYLTLHMKSHTGGTRPYSCLYCEKSFFGSSTLKKHMKTRHAYVSPEEMLMEAVPVPPPPEPAHCEIETQLAKVTMENGEEAHLIIGRRVETPPPKLIDQTVSSMDMDEDEFIYFEDDDIPESFNKFSEHGVLCNYCGKSFASKVTMTKHIRTVHLKTIKVECPICKMTTRDHYNLSKHISSHDPKLTKLSYNCPLCGDGFDVRRQVLRHYKKIHQLDLMREPIPQPIIRALRQNDPMNMPPLETQEYMKESVDAADVVIANPPSPVQPSGPRRRSFSVLQPNTGMEREAADAASVSVSNKAGLSPIKLESKVVPPTSVVAKIPTLSLKKKKRRKRRAILTCITRTKLLKQRARLLAAKLSPVKLEPQTPVLEMPVANPKTRSMGVKLNSKLPKMTTDSLESDDVFVQAAKRCHPGLMKLNFGIKLEIEKVQTIILSPEREDEEELYLPQDAINGVLQFTESAPEGTGAPNETPEMGCEEFARPLGVKIYGPKSKLAEIRANKLKLNEAKEEASANDPVPNDPKPPELTTSTTTVVTAQVPKFQPGQLRTYSGPKLKMASIAAGHQVSAILPNLTKVDGEGGHHQSVDWEKMDPLMTAIGLKRKVGPGQFWKSNRKDDVLPAPSASISPDGRALILKTIPTRNASASTLLSPPVGDTEQRGPIARSPPKLQPAPTNRVVYSTILQSQKIPSTSSPTFVVFPPNKSPSKYPLPNKQLAQIANSFRSRGAAKHGATAQVHPVKAKVTEMARQVIRSGVTNTKAVPFGRVTAAASTSGPIIESTHSLAGLPSPFTFVNSDLSNGNQRTVTDRSAPGRNPNLIAAFHESPQGKTAQVEALMRNSNIDVSLASPPPEGSSAAVVEPPVQEISPPFAMPRLPSGITLVQVEDVLKGNTTPKKDELVVLSPSPKRRFIFAKSLNKVAKRAKQAHDTTGMGVQDSQKDFRSRNSAPIRIRSMASLTDPLSDEPEETEPLEPSSSDMRGGNDYGAKTLVYLAPQVRTPHPAKTAAYRPFPQNETIRIMRYSEHIRVRREQEQQLHQQLPLPPLQQFRQVTSSPMTTSNVMYLPVQPVYRIQDSDPTFQASDE